MKNRTIRCPLVIVLLLNRAERNVNSRRPEKFGASATVFFVRGAETANIPRTSPLGEVLTLARGAGRILEPSVAFLLRPPWSKLQRYDNSARAKFGGN